MVIVGLEVDQGSEVNVGKGHKKDGSLKDRADLGKWREGKGKRAFQAKGSLNKCLKYGQGRGEKASDER